MMFTRPFNVCPLKGYNKEPFGFTLSSLSISTLTGLV